MIKILCGERLGQIFLKGQSSKFFVYFATYINSQLTQLRIVDISLFSVAYSLSTYSSDLTLMEVTKDKRKYSVGHIQFSKFLISYNNPSISYSSKNQVSLSDSTLTFNKHV